MSDHCEEQEMEAEALEAIFGKSFEIISSAQPFRWSIRLFPVDCDGGEEDDEQNHVGVKLIVNVPLMYPDENPDLDVEVIKGLAEEQRRDILDLAIAEAEANAGMPAVFTICEAVREWLVENNVKGQDDGSMYAQMMRRAKEAEKSKAQSQQQFESQKTTSEMTEAEKEEYEVRKRRAEGTPCTLETFTAWRDTFNAEKAEKARAEKEAAEKESASSKKKDSKKSEEDMSKKLTGFQMFSAKSGVMNLDAIEAAVEEAAGENMVNMESLDEELFDDDEDLDDLDFDSDDDESDEDEDEDEPDI